MVSPQPFTHHYKNSRLVFYILMTIQKEYAIIFITVMEMRLNLCAGEKLH